MQQNQIYLTNYQNKVYSYKAIIRACEQMAGRRSVNHVTAQYRGYYKQKQVKYR